MSKILITGSSGFLGKHLINSIQNSEEIIGWSNNIQQIKLKNFKHRKVDLTSKDISIKSKISSIIHLAAISDVKYCDSYPSFCSNVNILGTKKMLEICRKKDANFIFASTSHVYGKPRKNPICETEPTRPNSIYASTKIAGENLCELYAKTYGLNISVLRFFSIYGPNLPKHNVIFNIINQYQNNSVIKIGNLKPKRDFLFIDDAIEAVKLINEKQKGFEIFNIGSEKSFSIETVCNEIEKIMKKNMKINIDKNKIRQNDIPEIRSNNKKIRKMLGWKPKFNLNEGLRKTIEKI